MDKLAKSSKKQALECSSNPRTVLHSLTRFTSWRAIQSEDAAWASAAASTSSLISRARERRQATSRCSKLLHPINRRGVGTAGDQRIAITAKAEVMEKAASAPR